MIGARWRDQYAAMIVDVARLLSSPRAAGRGPADEDRAAAFDDDDAERDVIGGRGDFPAAPPRLPGTEARRRLTDFLQKRTGQRFDDDLRAWRKWLWSLPEAPHVDYAPFKAEVYARIDPAFRAFFPSDVKTAIRLDEIDWGGVRVNGIPPLRSPNAIRQRQRGSGTATLSSASR